MKKDREAIRERYMRDSLPVRIGGLAANLARAGSLSGRRDHRDVIAGLLDESRFFIEWTAPEAEPDLMAALVDLQVRMAVWRLKLDEIREDPAGTAKMAEQAKQWSERLLRLSGLVKDENHEKQDGNCS